MIVDKAVYRNGMRLDCGHPSQELERLRECEDGFLWIGIKDPTSSEFAEIDGELHLPEFAVDDAVNGNQRAKIDFYDDLMFVVLKTLRYIEQTSDVETGELMVFVGDRFVLTVRRGEVNPLAGVRYRLEQDPELLAHGPIAVMHAVIDHIVDTYRRIDRELADDLEDIEEAVFAGDRSVRGTDIYRLKREVLEFKRGTRPLLTPMNRIVRGEAQSRVPEELRPFFADILDHLLQVVDHAESYDRLLSDILHAYLAHVSVEQNDDMRKISAYVAMAAVPTMIAGVYGMNFAHMPELEWEYGYYLIVGIMIAIVTGLYIFFRRSNWL